MRTNEEQKLIDDFINSVEDEGKRLRLQQMQWRIDAELRKYKDPVARMNRMVEIFWEGFNEFNDYMQSISNGNDS